MPKFYKQNKKRIDPRYFLNETIDYSSLSDEELQYAQTRHRFNMESEEGKAISAEMKKRFSQHMRDTRPEAGWALQHPTFPSTEEEKISDPDDDTDDIDELMDMLKPETRDDLGSFIRGRSKDLTGHRSWYGLRGRELDDMSAEELRDIIRDMDISPEARDFDQELESEEDVEMGHEQDLSHEETMPKQQGFGRRPRARRPWPKRS